MKSLHYTIQENELKGMGYIFQKLYAADYKTYRLEIEKWHMTIWLWVINKNIEVNDWYGFTYNVLEFYKANRDDEKWLEKSYIKIGLNRDTGDIIMYNRWEEYDIIWKAQDGKAMNAIIEKYDKYQEIFLSKEKMDRVLIEIEKLNPVVKE